MKIEKHIFTHLPKEYFPYRHVVYVESRYNERINQYIQLLHFPIPRFCELRGIKFVYLPREVAKLRKVSLNKDPKSVLELNSELLNYLKDETPDEIPPSLFFSMEKERKSEEAVVYSIPFDLTQPPCQIYDMIDWVFQRVPYAGYGQYPRYYVEELKKKEKLKPKEKPSEQEQRASHPPIMFMKAMPYEDKTRIAEAIHMAQLNGANEAQVHKLVSDVFKHNRKLSRVTITKDYRIFLEDRGKRIEVIMTDLPKALYLFFLKHEEGVDKDKLYKYLPELVYIYITIKSNWVSGEKGKIIKRINGLIGNQFPNNIKEIKDAFGYAIDDRKVYSVNLDDESKGNNYLIKIPSANRVWQCPNILNRHLPTVDNLKGLEDKARDILNECLPEEIHQYYGG